MDAEVVAHWVGLGGTGVLQGVETSGTTRMLAEFKDGKVIGRFERTRSRCSTGRRGRAQEATLLDGAVTPAGQ